MLGWNITNKMFWENYIEYKLINIGGFKIKKVTGYKNIEHLKKKLKEYGCIFMKTEDVLTLPEQQDIVVKIENTKEYKQFKKDRVLLIDDIVIVGDNTLNKILYLRQLASQYNKNKINTLKDLIDSTTKRIIIFYNFTKELELIKSLTDRKISIVNGNTKDLDNYENYSDSITLVQYQAGATGLNLQLADIIIYFSLPLSAELFEQSKKRIHRIGQKNNCKYYYLNTINSIDEDIFETLKMRKDYTNKLFEEEEIKMSNEV